MKNAILAVVSVPAQNRTQFDELLTAHLHSQEMQQAFANIREAKVGDNLCLIYKSREASKTSSLLQKIAEFYAQIDPQVNLTDYRISNMDQTKDRVEIQGQTINLDGMKILWKQPW